jgi:hypothetical protein
MYPVKCYLKKLATLLLEIFLVCFTVFLFSCAAGSGSGGDDIGSYKGVSNISILQLHMTGDSEAQAELITFEIPYERLPVRDKEIVDAKGWYKAGDMVTIKYQISTHDSWISTPSGQWHKVK